MQHLFLTSSVGVPPVARSIRKHLGTDKPLRTVFLSTPVEGDADQDDLSWVDDERNELNKYDFVTFDYTITGKNLAQIRQDLEGIEVLYISGGNEFYLKEKSNESHFEEFVHDFVGSGGIYIGTSGGSIIAGTDMTPLQNLSDLKGLSAPVDNKGFGLVNFTILPHWGSTEFRDRWLSSETFDLIYQERTNLIALNNYQYIEVLGDKFKIIDARKE